MVRALLWLLPAILLFAVLVALIAPPGAGAEAAALGAIAIVPGLLVVGLVAVTRRRSGTPRDQEEGR